MRGRISEKSRDLYETCDAWDAELDDDHDDHGEDHEDHGDHGDHEHDGANCFHFPLLLLPAEPRRGTFHLLRLAVLGSSKIFGA
jgi:hypothetical protein